MIFCIAKTEDIYVSLQYFLIASLLVSIYLLWCMQFTKLRKICSSQDSSIEWVLWTILSLPLQHAKSTVWVIWDWCQPLKYKYVYQGFIPDIIIIMYIKKWYILYQLILWRYRPFIVLGCMVLQLSTFMWMFYLADLLEFLDYFKIVWPNPNSG